MDMKKIAVLGDGGWGTTLAIHLYKKGFKVVLWGAFKDYIGFLKNKRVNSKFLPGVRIPQEIKITASLAVALNNASVIILAIPAQYLRSILKKLKRFDTFATRKPRPFRRGSGGSLSINPEHTSSPSLRYGERVDLSDVIILNVAKGIEISSLKRMSEVINEELGYVKQAILSGPTIAREVALGIPTTAVVSSRDISVAKHLQEVFNSERFRIYTNNDLIGVELGGSLKNIIAIACGISDGLGFGTNTKAALLARGLAEMTRLGKKMGACERTFFGISGLGDLVTTCISQFSRNRFLGEEIGKGKNVKSVIKHMQMPACRQAGLPSVGQAGIAEGYPTAKSVYELSKKFKVEMPITAQIYSVLYKNKNPLKAVNDLMMRKIKGE